LSPDEFETVPLRRGIAAGFKTSPRIVTALLSGDERVTYSELAARAGMVGRSLIALGIERGDRVGILMANGLDFTDLLFGASLIGAIPVLYNARFKAREIAHVTADAGIKVVVTNNTVEDHTDYVELLNKAEVQKAPSMQHQVFLGAGHREGFMDRDTFCGVAESVDPNEVEKRHAGTAITDTALMFYTSGTTAMPKGCPLDHIVLQHAGVVGGTDRLRLIESDVVWSPLPMFHSAFTQPLTGTLHVGGTLVSMAHFEPDKALDQITREGVTVAFPAFPTITLQLLHHPRYTPETLSGVRVMLNVGPPEELGAMQGANARIPLKSPALG
jgi:acyl-CoA synthetase (AMP-forming)/AMP-acid ligase II